MTDYIKREDAIKVLEGWKISGEMILKTVPSADVRENVKGEWIKLDEEPVYIIECSECGDKLLNMIGQPLPKFCSNCGAEMKGERHDMR